MNDRIPCRICETVILPVTAKTNAGLCGQCVRDPENATRRAARKKTRLSWGEPSPEAIQGRLSDACYTAAIEAVARFSTERIYGFFLYLDPTWESVSGARVFTEEWALSKTAESRWTPLYTEETYGYIVGEEMTKAVSEFAANSASGYDFFCGCLHALRTLRERSVFTGRVVLGASSGDESEEETIAFAERVNLTDVSEWYRSSVTYDPSLLELRRQQYAKKEKGT